MDILGIFGVVVGAGVVLAGIAFGASMRVVEQFERGVVFRFGRVRAVREPGLRALIPFVDRMRKVPVQIVTMPVPGQEGITRDNVTVRVDAVVYFRVIDPVQAVVDVRTTCSRSRRWRRPRCARSSARAIWMICCPIANISTGVSSS
jgi:regulator of protease activity HflC (stomatin/prohibitin superfamily)